MQTTSTKTIKLVHTKCPKCGGKLFIDRDAYGWFESCLCGYNYNLSDPNIKAPVPAKDLKDY